MAWESALGVLGVDIGWTSFGQCSILAVYNVFTQAVTDYRWRFL
jgi:hypothetical protein